MIDRLFNRNYVSLILALAIGIAMTLMLITPSPANAERRLVRTPNDQLGKCAGRGYVTDYYIPGRAIEVGGDEYDTFREFYCQHNHLRLYKSEANTATEFSYLLDFAKYAPEKGRPVAFCPVVAGEEAYLIDLGLDYWPVIKKLNKPEKKNYRKWIRQYSAANGCTVFVQK